MYSFYIYHMYVAGTTSNLYIRLTPGLRDLQNSPHMLRFRHCAAFVWDAWASHWPISNVNYFLAELSDSTVGSNDQLKKWFWCVGGK